MDDLRIARVPFRQGYLEEEIGVLEIGVSRAQHHAASRTTGVTLLLFCGLLLGLGVATVHGVSKRLAGPVEDLAAEFGGILEHAPSGSRSRTGAGAWSAPATASSARSAGPGPRRPGCTSCSGCRPRSTAASFSG